MEIFVKFLRCGLEILKVNKEGIGEIIWWFNFFVKWWFIGLLLVVKSKRLYFRNFFDFNLIWNKFLFFCVVLYLIEIIVVFVWIFIFLDKVVLVKYLIIVVELLVVGNICLFVLVFNCIFLVVNYFIMLWDWNLVNVFWSVLLFWG